MGRRRRTRLSGGSTSAQKCRNERTKLVGALRRAASRRPLTIEPLERRILLSITWTGTQEFAGDQNWAGETIIIDGPVEATIHGDMTLAADSLIRGNADGAGFFRDDLTLNVDGTLYLYGDIAGGGIRDIAINADQILVDTGALISSRYISGSDYRTDWSTDDSGTISLSAPDISITGAHLFSHVEGGSSFAAGDISLVAADYVGFYGAGPAQVRMADTGITLSSATLIGGNVLVQAVANTAEVFGEDSTPFNVSLDLLDYVPTPMGAALSDVSATIDVSGASLLRAADTLQILADGASETSAMYISNCIAASYSRSDLISTVTVGGTTTLESGGDLTIHANGDNTQSVTSMTVNSGSNHGTGAQLSFGMLDGDLTTSADVQSGTTVWAGGSMTVESLLTQSLSISNTAGAFKDGFLGTAVSLSEIDAETFANLGGAVDVAGDLTVNAQQDTPKNDTATSAGVGNSIGGKIMSTLFDLPISAITGNVNPFAAGKASLSAKGGTTATVGLGVAASVAWHDYYAAASIADQISTVVDGEILPASAANSRVYVAGQLDVTSTVLDVPEISAMSSVDSDKASDDDGNKIKAAVSAAVCVGIYDHHSYAFIGDDAEVGAQTLQVQSLATEPYEIQWADLFDSDFEISEVVDKLNANLGLQNGFCTSWAQSSAKGTEVAIAGSINILDINNTSRAFIGEDALINQVPDWQSDDQDVLVAAMCEIETVNLSGCFGLKGIGVGADKAGVGGSYVHIDYDNTTEAVIHGGAQVWARSLEVTADTEVQDISIAESGSNSGGFGVAGSFSLAMVDNETTARIDNGVQVDVRPGAGAGLLVEAEDLSKIINVSGGVVMARNASIGFGITLCDVNRDTRAEIGTEGGSGGQIRGAGSGPVTVKATNTGGIGSWALSGAFPAPELTQKAWNPGYQKSEEKSGSKFGLGVSCDVGINDVDDNAYAGISGFTSVEAPGISVIAHGQTDILSIVGAVSVGYSEGVALGLAASFAYNSIEGYTVATVQDTPLDLDDGDLLVQAQYEGDILAFGVSGTVAVASGGESTLQAGAAGQAVYNEFAGQEIVARIDGGSVTDAGAVSVLADNDAYILAVSGALSIAAGSAPAGVGVGAAVGINRFTESDGVRSAVTAEIVDCPVAASGAVRVLASFDAQITTIAAAGSFSMGDQLSLAAAVSVSSNLIDVDVQARLDAASPLSLDGSDVEVRATNASGITSIAGAGAVAINTDYKSVGAAVGAASADNTISGTVGANVINYDIDATGAVTVRTATSDTIIAVAAGVAGGTTIGGAGSMALNEITRTVRTQVDSSTIDAAGHVWLSVSELIDPDVAGIVTGEDPEDIWKNSSIAAVAGSVALGAMGGAANASLATNSLLSAREVLVTASTVTSTAAGVTVGANNDGKISSLAVGGSGAGGFAAGGSVTLNTIGGSLDVNVSDSALDAHTDAAVVTSDSSAIESIAGQAATSSGGAIGAAVVTNDIFSGIAASVADSAVTATTGTATVATTAGSTIKTVGAGGAYANTFAAGGSVTLNKIYSTVATSVTGLGTTVSGAGDVAVTVDNSRTIESYAGALSIATTGGAAVGAGVATNDIGGSTTLDVDAATVQSDSGKATVTATADGSVMSVAAGGAGAGQFAAGGSVTLNSMIGTLSVDLAPGTQVSGPAGVIVGTTDSATVQSLAGSVALSGFASAGAAVATNEIAQTIETVLNEAVLYSSSGDVAVSSDSTSTVECIATGLAGSGQAAMVGGVALNEIGNTIKTSISESALTSDTGDVSVRAVDTSTISSAAGVVAVGLGVAGVGGAGAYNDIANNITAEFTAGTLTATLGNVIVEAEAAGTISTVGAAGGGGWLGAVAGTIVVENIGNSIRAAVGSADVTAGDSVLVNALWNGILTADGGTGSLAGFVGIGGSIVLLNLANDVNAIVYDSTVLADGNGGGLSITRWQREPNAAGWQDDRVEGLEETLSGFFVIADSNETISNSFGTVGVTLGVGVNVNKSVSLVGDTTWAAISNGEGDRSDITADAVYIRAHQDTNVDSQGGVSGGSALGAVGGMDTTIVDNDTRAIVIGQDTPEPTAISAGSGGVEVSAWSQDIVHSETGSAGVTAVAGATGAFSAVDILSNTTAQVGMAQVDTTGNLDVTATRIADVETKAGAISVSLLAGVGGSVDFVTIAGTTEAFMIGARTNAAGDTSVQALSLTQIDGRSGTGGGGGIASVCGASAIHVIETTTQAYLQFGGPRCTINADPAYAGGDQDVAVSATDRGEIYGRAGTYSASVGGGVGGSIDVGVIRNSARAEIGPSVWVNAGGAVDVEALTSQFVESSVTAFGIGAVTGIAGAVSAVGIGGGIHQDAHDEISSVAGTLNGLLDLSGGIPGLASDQTAQDVEAILSSRSLTIDNAIATDPEADGSVRATVGAYARIDAGGPVEVFAGTAPGTKTEIGQVAAGLIVGAGGSLGTVSVSEDVEAAVGDQAWVRSQADVKVWSLTAKSTHDTEPTVDVDVVTGEGGAVVGLGSARACIAFVVSNKAGIGVSANLAAGGTLTVEADTILNNIDADVDGTTIGGIVADGDVEVVGNAAAETNADVGSGAVLAAGGELGVRARTEVTDVNLTSTGGMGGVAGFGGCYSDFTFSTLNTFARIGSNGSLTSDVRILAESRSAIDMTSTSDQKVNAAGNDNSVYSRVLATPVTRVWVLSNAVLAAPKVKIGAFTEDVYGLAFAKADNFGFFCSSLRSDAHVNYTVDTHVNIFGGAVLDAPGLVEIRAETGNVFAETAAGLDVDSIDPDLVVLADCDLEYAVDVAVQTGARLETSDLDITVDPLTGSHHYKPDGGQISASGLDPDVTYIWWGDETRDANITFNGDAVYQPDLYLRVDAGLNIDPASDLPATINHTTQEIVLDYVSSIGPVRPTAFLFANYEGTVVGTGRFVTAATSSCTIINESTYAVRTDGILADGQMTPNEWIITAAVDTSDWNPTTSAVSQDNRPVLRIDSVGDVRLSGWIDLPDGSILIESDGDILNWGAWAYLAAMQFSLDAGGGIGTAGTPLALGFRTTGVAMLECVAEADVWISAGARTTDPNFAELQLNLHDLAVAGDLNLEYLGFEYYDAANSLYVSRPTHVLITGRAEAGGNFNLTQWHDGLLNVNQPITAGDSVNLYSDGAVFLFQSVSAGNRVSVSAGTDIVGSPYQLLTAHDVSLDGGNAVGGVGDAVVKVDLDGGVLDAEGRVDIGVREVSGPLRVGTVRCSQGQLRLEALDTGGVDDGIILGDGAEIYAHTWVTLTAGDYLTQHANSSIQATRVMINLDTAVPDADPGIGADYALDGDLFTVSQGTELDIEVTTGRDDDSLAVTALPIHAVLDIDTEAGDDMLSIGDGGYVLDIDGQLNWQAGAGIDRLLLDDTASSVGRIWQMRTDVVMPAVGIAYPSISGNAMYHAAWYRQVEHLELDLSTGSDVAQIDATDPSLQTVAVRGNAGNDVFTVGEDGGWMLSSVHGRLMLDGGSNDGGPDFLNITENNWVGPDLIDSLLTPNSVERNGMDGIDYDGFEYLTLTLGAQDDIVTVTALDIPATVDVGDGDNHVILGTPDVPLREAFASIVDLRAGAGRDVLEVINTADSVFREGAVSDTELSGMGLPWGAPLDSFEEVIVHLGSGGNRFDVNMTAPTPVTVHGGAGDDEVRVWSLPNDARAMFHGAAGDDTLRVLPSSVDSVNGYIFFRGDAGTDDLIVDGSSLSAGWLVSLEAAPTGLTGVQPGDAWVRGLGMDNGVIYNAENLDVSSGSGLDTFYLTATSDGTQSVRLKTGASEDDILVGGLAGSDMRDLHGWIDVRQDQAEDALTIRSATPAGTQVSGAVSADRITGLGIEGGLLVDRLKSLSIYGGAADEDIVVSSLPVLSDSVVNIGLGAGDDRLTLGGVDAGGGADLDRLTGMTLAFGGGDGQDVLVLDDGDSASARRNTLINGVNIQNLGFDQIGALDFEQLDIFLNDHGNAVRIADLAMPTSVGAGEGDDTFTVLSGQATPDTPLTIDGGEGDDVLHVGEADQAHNIIAHIDFTGGGGSDTATVHDLAADGQLTVHGGSGHDYFNVEDIAGTATFYGGDWNDFLTVGSPTTWHTVIGSVIFYGEVGDDQATVYQVAPDGWVAFEADMGDDQLILGGSDTLLPFDHIDGAVFLNGDNGDDAVIADASASGSPVNVWFEQPAVLPAPYEAADMSSVRWSGMFSSVFYSAERVDTTLSSNDDDVHVRATNGELEQATVNAGAGIDRFYIEAEGATSLVDIYGRVDLDGGPGADQLRINNEAVLYDFDCYLSNSTFAGWGLEYSSDPQFKVAFDQIEDVDIFLGDGSDYMMVGPTDPVPDHILVSLGGGDDMLDLGYDWEADLAVLAPLAGDMTVGGGDGNDEVFYCDWDNADGVDGHVTGDITQGLTTGQIATLDFEFMGIYLGSGPDALAFTNPSLPTEVDGGPGDDQFEVLALEPTGILDVWGGLGADVFHVGDPTSNADVAGELYLGGQFDDDTAYVYKTAVGALVTFDGGYDDDLLVPGMEPSFQPGSNTAMWMDGALIFTGGSGYDVLDLDETIIGPEHILHFNKSLPPGGGVEFGTITGLGMDAGIWYDSESVDVQLASEITHTNEIYIDATSRYTWDVTVNGAAGRDYFYVGQDPTLQLGEIDSLLHLHGAGGSNYLTISDLGGGITDQMHLTRDCFYSNWVEPLYYSGMREVRIIPDDYGDHVTIESVSTSDYTNGMTYVDNVGPNDRIVIGQTVFPESDLRVNDLIPIYATIALGFQRSYIRLWEGESFNDPIHITDEIGDRDILFTYATPGYIQEWNGQDRWYYDVPSGPDVQTIQFRAEDTGGFVTTKLLDVEIRNIAPVARNDAYTVRESTLLDAASVLLNDQDAYDPLTAVLYTDVQHGTLTLDPDGTFTYMPDSGWIGTDSFTYFADDGHEQAGPATVTIDVWENHAPAAGNDALQARETLGLTFAETALLANDNDPDADPLEPVVQIPPQHGTLTDNGDGTWTYTPVADYVGQDAFTYCASDGLALSNEATVSIDIIANAVPVAVDDAFTTRTFETLTISQADLLSNDSDGDNDPLEPTILTQPQHGTMTDNGDGTWTYTADAGYVGQDALSYVVTDGLDESNTATVTIDVVPNAVPVAVDDRLSTSAGLAFTFADADLLANDHDDENDPLSVLLQSQPGHGTLTDNGDGTYTYQPDPGFNGIDSFIYVADDTFDLSAPVTVTLAVMPSDVLFVDDDSTATPADPLYGLTWASAFPDLEEALDEFAARRNDADPANDIAAVWLAEGTYVPSQLREAGLARSAAFHLRNGLVLCGGFTGTEASLEERAFDEDGLALHQSILSGDIQRNGTWSDNAFTVVYCGGATGVVLDSLTIRDGYAHGQFSNLHSERRAGGGLYMRQGNIRMQNVPFLHNSAYQTGGAINQFLGVLTLDNVLIHNNRGLVDAGGIRAHSADLRVTNSRISNNRANRGGGLYLSSSAVRFANVEFLDNTANFQHGGGIYALGGGIFRQCVFLGNHAEGRGGAVYHGDSGTVQIHSSTIAGNSAGGLGGGVFGAGTVTTFLTNSIIAENMAASGDPDLSGTFSADTVHNLVGVGPSSGSVVNGVSGNIVGTVAGPAVAGFVRPPSLYPGDPDLRLTPAGTAVNAGDQTVLPSDWHDLDNDGDSTEPLPIDFEGKARVFAGQVDMGAWELHDASLAPVAENDAYSVREQTLLDAASVLDNDSTTSPPLTAVLVTDVDHGTLVLDTDGTFTYMPDAGWLGQDTFTYVANDTVTASLPATVSITVWGNHAPTAVADSLQAREMFGLSFTDACICGNDLDPDGDPLEPLIGTQPQHGTLTDNGDGTWHYAPVPGYVGRDAFTYRATDGLAQSGEVTVTIDVIANHLPVAEDDRLLVEPGMARTFSHAELLSNDSDGDSDPLQVLIETLPAHGGLTDNGDGTFTYTPAPGFLGLDQFTYVATDTCDVSAPATVSLGVVAQGVLFVDDNSAATGAEPFYGRSWDCAFASVQDALDQWQAVNSDADPANNVSSIWIAAGTYTPTEQIEPGTERSAAFRLRSGMRLYGGFAGTELLLSERAFDAEGMPLHETILSGEIQGNGIWTDNAWTVLCADDVSAVTLDTMTIGDGRADGPLSTTHPERRSGGGLYAEQADVLLRKTRFANNYAAESGGAIFSVSGSLDVTNSRIKGNVSDGDGAGLYVSGSAVVTNTVLLGNHATGSGGGMFVASAGTAVQNATLAGNSAGGMGGGLFCPSTLSVDLFNSIIADNDAAGGDPDVSTGFCWNVKNCLIGIGPASGGIMNGWYGNMIGTIYRPIVAGFVGPPSLRPDDPDVHLLISSPAADAGNSALLPADQNDLDGDGNTTEPLPVDLGGHARVSYSALDMGAWELRNDALGTPGVPDLLPTSDTGVDDADDLTNRNNSADRPLEFLVPGTVAGAVVTLYADSQPIGNAVAAGDSVVISTDGAWALADGAWEFTARQAVPGRSQSPSSEGLAVTIDTVFGLAPQDPVVINGDAAAGGRSQIRTITWQFGEPPVNPPTLAHFALWNLDASTMIDLSSRALTSTATTVTLTLDTPGLDTAPQLFLPDGNYVLNLYCGPGSLVDAAGNPLDADADGSPDGSLGFSFHKLLGDFDGNRSVGNADLNMWMGAYQQPAASVDRMFDMDCAGDVIDYADFTCLQTCYGHTVPSRTDGIWVSDGTQSDWLPQQDLDETAQTSSVLNAVKVSPYTAPTLETDDASVLKLSPKLTSDWQMPWKQSSGYDAVTPVLADPINVPLRVNVSLTQ